MKSQYRVNPKAISFKTNSLTLNKTHLLKYLRPNHPLLKLIRTKTNNKKEENTSICLSST